MPQTQLVIVDTNCFVRLYMSPVRPLLGQVVGGYHLVTLTELHLETSFHSNVRERHPWMGAKDIQNEIGSACIKLREPKKSRIAQATFATRAIGNRWLADHCKAQNIVLVRELSLNDARALATADELGGVLATDEWPLRHVAVKMELDQTGQLLDSIAILHLLETTGSLNRGDRIQTARTWVQQEGQGLLRDWKQRYQDTFGEAAPDGQSVNSAKA